MTANEVLDNYLGSLPRRESIAKSRDIREKLCISRDVLCNWRRGRTEIHPVFWDKIKEIIGEDLREYVVK